MDILTRVGLDHIVLDHVEVFLFIEHVLLQSKVLLGICVLATCK